jgi:hypothetical protein
MKHTLKNIYNVRKLRDRTNYYNRGRVSRMSKIYLQNIDKYFKYKTK